MPPRAQVGRSTAIREDWSRCVGRHLSGLGSESVTVYGLWQRQLFVFLFWIGGGILWDTNPTPSGPRHVAWIVGILTIITLGSVQVLRARLVLTFQRVRYIGLLKSWSVDADELVAIELRSTRAEMGNGAGGLGGFPAFRDRDGHWHRCPMCAFRTSDRAARAAEQIRDYLRSNGHDIEITSLSTL